MLTLLLPVYESPTDKVKINGTEYWGEGLQSRPQLALRLSIQLF